MRRQRADHTLQTSALISEAYLRLIDRKIYAMGESKAHFCAVAAQAMRRTVIDHAYRYEATAGIHSSIPLENQFEGVSSPLRSLSRQSFLRVITRVFSGTNAGKCYNRRQQGSISPVISGGGLQCRPRRERLLDYCWIGATGISLR